MDRWSRRLVSFGGAAVIVAILAILVVIVSEVAPLFVPARATRSALVRVSPSSAPLTVGTDEYRETACVVGEGGISFHSLVENQPIDVNVPLPPDGARIVSATPVREGAVFLGLSDGRIWPVDLRFEVSFPQGKRVITPGLTAKDPESLLPDRIPVKNVAFFATEDGPVVAAPGGPRKVALLRMREKRSLIGGVTRDVRRYEASLATEGTISALALGNAGRMVLAGTTAGELALVGVDEEDPRTGPDVKYPVFQATARRGLGISALGFLLGGETLVVGDIEGGVATFQIPTEAGGTPRLERIHTFSGHRAPIHQIEESRRDKGFITADPTGLVHLHYGTNGETWLAIQAATTGLAAVTLSHRGDGLLAADCEGQLLPWRIVNPHPEFSLAAIFGRIRYEGYPREEFVWQSTGGTDDFESKLSLTPLIYGTLKGTFYALLFAVPMALLAALYASQFLHPTFKSTFKPAVEIMAALPSVVLGFIAGLWLAPMVEKIVPGLVLALPIVLGLVLLAAYGWSRMPRTFRRRLKPGAEILILGPVLVCGIWLALALGPTFEAALLAGDYRAWLYEAVGLTFDQRNSLVVGLAMGFAVIPIIFTIAEDSLSNVPQHLAAGSLALGATRWQTAMGVILPTASPGIFSAVMIGFGRAVGETMIVLMATGNTPVMEFSVFNGFRALSANIAVELPEAPEGGTLYRILFLAALFLFVLTFVLNTAAELVRLRLRKRYRYL